MKRILIPLFAAALSLAACSESVIYTCEDGTRIRLTPVTDEIVHVEAVSEGAEFSSAQSLAVLELKKMERKKPKARQSEDEDSFCLETSALKVEVGKKDGKVKFSRGGEVLAAESGRTFTPIEVEGVKGWSVRQSFVPQDEGFFGLGQHQADEWNYKGRNEELYQYNTKISVPFVVSTKGYGLLWDSNSLCRWGNPRPYSPLGDVFVLRDKYGVEGALTGTYVPAEGKPLIRRETSIGQEFLRTPECDRVIGAPEGFKFYGSRVTFEGTIEPRESGLHHFYIYYAGYTKVFIGGEQVTPEIWRTAWNPNGSKFECNLTKGERVPVRIEWKPDGDVSYCALKALSPVEEQEQAAMSWWGEMQDGVDYYFIAGERPDDVISGYRTLTGRAQIPPKWALGFWQSYERYKTQDEVLAALGGFRSRDIPVDNIVQDWQYWEDDKWGSHEFDASRYPDPKGMVDSIHALGARFMISVWPKFYAGTEHFEEMDSNGWIYQTAIRDSVEDWLGYQQSFYDAYSAPARKLFWQQMKDHLYPTGVDAWWMDASEPNIHDCTDMDYRKQMCGPTALGPSTKYFNAYALMNAQAIYEGQRESDDRRVFLLTRNGFAGLQRYSTASWSGDIGTRWEDMKAQISAGLNYSISGIPLWGQDVGGFSVETRYATAQWLLDNGMELTEQQQEDLKEWRELNVRWHEWGRFTPLYRSHGQFPRREPWNIAPEGSEEYEAILNCIKGRYTMMPYLYSLAARVHFDDYTLMRPLVMDFTSDEKAVNTSDEFMCGDAVLVCPVYEYGARSREVYLPEGCGWYRFRKSGVKYHEGGQTLTADAPLSAIPVYFREGSILVSAPEVQSTAQAQPDMLITVFGGKDASFRLYDDNGVDYAYEKGDFEWIPLTWNEQGRTLKIGKREGRCRNAAARHWFTVSVQTKDGGTEPQSVEYCGKEITLKF